MDKDMILQEKEAEVGYSDTKLLWASPKRGLDLMEPSLQLSR